MTIFAFLAAAFALLIAPGPTNTLMAVAAAQNGLRRSARLISAEIAGYLVIVLPLSYIGSQLFAVMPWLVIALEVGAAIWVMVLAVKLWRQPTNTARESSIGFRDVFVTTVMNPKGLVLGLVLLPPFGSHTYSLHLGGLILLVAVVAGIWGSMGALLQSPEHGPKRVRLLKRVASCWLAVVSITLATKAVRL